MVVAILIVCGLVLGSFVNAFVWRLHEQAELQARKKKPTKQQIQRLSILRGHSMCPNCRHRLAAKDLLPVVSWLWLRGRCRYCGEPISWQYPVVEILTAALFVLSYLYWPVAFTGIGVQQFVVWLGFVTMFVALAVYDLRWLLLPNRITYPLIVVAAVETLVVGAWRHSPSDLWGPAVAALIISGLFWLLFQISDGKWIGGGDVKLAVVLGLWAASPLKALLLILIASVIGTLVSVPLMAANGRGIQMKVPFGPFLLTATVIVVLFGGSMVDWYTLRFI